MGVILGLAAAFLYGGSDFAGGLTSRKLGALPVNVVGSSVAAALAWVALLAVGGPGPTVHAVAWGLASGLGGGIGTTMLPAAWPAGRGCGSFRVRPRPAGTRPGRRPFPGPPLGAPAPPSRPPPQATPRHPRPRPGRAPLTPAM